MKDYIELRVMEIADYILEKRTTVRNAAKHFKISKSTVQKDMSERLEKINPDLHKKVKSIMDINKAERHIRGGIATHNKYKEIHKKLP